MKPHTNSFLLERLDTIIRVKSMPVSKKRKPKPKVTVLRKQPKNDKRDHKALLSLVVENIIGTDDKSELTELWNRTVKKHADPVLIAYPVKNDDSKLECQGTSYKDIIWLLLNRRLIDLDSYYQKSLVSGAITIVCFSSFPGLVPEVIKSGDYWYLYRLIGVKPHE